MKKLILGIMSVFLITGCGGEEEVFEKITEGKVDDVSFKETNEVTNYVKIVTMDSDVIIAELYPDVAPITVENFGKLIEEKFYDGIIFHRVIEDFMIQTGDPLGNGTGGSDETIKGEFSENGVENDLSHERGVLSMARSSLMDSASSQFFIVHQDSNYLDGSYAAFGKVIAGLDTVDKIATVDTDTSDKPLEEIIIESIRFVEIEKEEFEKITEGKVDDVSFKETNEVTNYVKIVTMDSDVIIAELYPDVAPITVENFGKLIEEKFYDGIIFHRVIEDFMIQTGDPLGNGTGGSDETIKGEFSENGVENDLSHERGVLSMARSSLMDSASSQFFIVHQDSNYLDGSYAAFGKVIAGLDTVDKIATVDTDTSDKPLEEIIIESIRFVEIEE